MRVVALKAWSNGSVSMEERQIAELPDALAAQLIAQGIVAPTALPEITDADDGKVLTANSGVWGAQNLPIRVFDIDVNIDEGFTQLTPTSTTVYPTVDELEMISANNVAVACHLHVSDVSVNNTIYLRPARIDADGLLFLYGGFSADYGPLLCYGGIGTDGININIFNHNRFIVTLTPTAADYSGTMDKTVSEINAAYESGQQVVFHLDGGPVAFVETPISYYTDDGSHLYNGFSTNIVQIEQNLFIVVYVGSTDDGTRTTYSTKIYTLTPAT